jgi:hypothetical protein
MFINIPYAKLRDNLGTESLGTYTSARFVMQELAGLLDASSIRGHQVGPAFVISHYG